MRRWLLMLIGTFLVSVPLATSPADTVSIKVSPECGRPGGHAEVVIATEGSDRALEVEKRAVPFEMSFAPGSFVAVIRAVEADAPLRVETERRRASGGLSRNSVAGGIVVYELLDGGAGSLSAMGQRECDAEQG